MTAINVVVHEDAALMFTDAAVSHEGVVTAIASKVVRLPHLSAILSVTGSDYAFQIAREHVGHTATTFDDLVAGMAEAVAEGLEFHREVIDERGGDAPLDIHAVGWSDRHGRFKAYSCAYRPGSPPTVIDAGALILQPGDPEVIDRLARLGMDPATVMSLDLNGAVQFVARVMGVQRTYAASVGDNVIGGFQELTMIDRTQIVSRVVQRWPDRVGGRVRL